jgi:ABC-2 type transport system permease protein
MGVIVLAAYPGAAVRGTLRLGFELARRGYGRYAAYPGATWAGLFTNSFFGLLIAYVMLAVYERREEVGGYDVAAALTYVWLAQGLLSVVASFGPSWTELALRVRSGDVATDMYRPVDLQRALFAQDVGRAGYQVIWRAVPQFLLGALLFEVTVPAEAVQLLAFGLSVCIAIVVSFAIRFMVNLSAFWLLDYRGPMLLVLTVAHLLSGLIVPLAFFPEPVGDILRALPFAAMLQTPIDIWVGEPLGGSTLGALLLQVGWAVTLVLAGRLVLSAGTQKLVVQGG